MSWDFKKRMRETNPALDFAVSVDGLGDFTFGRRTLKDNIDIGVEFSLLTHGVSELNENVRTFCECLAAIRVLMVSAPSGFSLDDLSPLEDDDCYSKVYRIHDALRVAEDSFRKGKNAKG